MSQRKKVFSDVFMAVLCLIAALLVGVGYYVYGLVREDLYQKPTIIAAVGDSNTFGAGVAPEERTVYSYPAQLQSMLGMNYSVHNFGVNGATVLSGTPAPYAQQKAYIESKNVAADIVLIMLGTNDVHARNWGESSYERQMSALVTVYKNLPSNPKVYVLTPPTLYTEKDSLLVNEAIPVLKKISAAMDVPLIDIHSATENRASVFPDKIHPTATGYGLIAEAVYEKLRVNRQPIYS
jgi:lysophospholipase L1-like esterase